MEEERKTILPYLIQREICQRKKYDCQIYFCFLSGNFTNQRATVEIEGYKKLHPGENIQFFPIKKNDFFDVEYNSSKNENIKNLKIILHGHSFVMQNNGIEIPINERKIGNTPIIDIKKLLISLLKKLPELEFVNIAVKSCETGIVSKKQDKELFDLIHKGKSLMSNWIIALSNRTLQVPLDDSKNPQNMTTAEYICFELSKDFPDASINASGLNGVVYTLLKDGRKTETLGCQYYNHNTCKKKLNLNSKEYKKSLNLNSEPFLLNNFF